MRGLGVYAIPGWFKDTFLDLREDARDAAAHGRSLMVYVGQDGCPDCAELFNNDFSQAHIVDGTRRQVDAVSINLWGDRELAPAGA